MTTTKPIICLAPMDGITDLAYRQIVRKLNPEVLLFSEFTSINGIEHSNVVRDRLNFAPHELPYIVQIFGNEPELFGKITRELNDSGITGIDINMGCPAKKIIKHKSGGSLIQDQDLACRIVEACVKNTTLPVSVKTRLGWTDHQDLITFSKALVNAGAHMLSIHGRTYKQAYRGFANWDPIYDLKQAVTVPIIGNGDIKGEEDALDRMKNLDGYMVGRGSIGNPWVFWNQERRDQLTLKDKVTIMIEHFQLMRSYKEEHRALVEFRKHMSGYITGFQDAKYHRGRLMKCTSEQEFIQTALSLG